MRRRFEDFDDAEVKDGESVRVPMSLMDSGQRAVHQRFRTTTSDAIRATGPHRPMPVQDALFAVRMSTRDAAGLAGAMARRQLAFDQLEERSKNAWRDGPAVVQISPREATPIRQPLNSMPPMPYDQTTRWLPPVGNGNGDDDDDNENGNGDLTAPPDPDDDEQMQKAFAARDRARMARDQRGNTAYMNPPNLWTTANLSVPNNGRLDPREADRVEAIRRATVLR